MNYFVVHDPTTGAIRRSGFCTQPRDVAGQARSGEAVREVDQFYPPGKFKVDLTKTPPVVVPN